jgi:hypothetical protein
MVAQNISEAILDVWATYFRIPAQNLRTLFLIPFNFSAKGIYSEKSRKIPHVNPPYIIRQAN